jgi:hypothetical protein
MWLPHIPAWSHLKGRTQMKTGKRMLRGVFELNRGGSNMKTKKSA